jgi:Bax protein
MKLVTVVAATIILNFSLLLHGEILLNSYEEIETAHRLLNYKWRSKSVPRLAIKKIPEEIKEMSPAKKIRFFVKTMLPLILLENEKIEIERKTFFDYLQRDSLDEEEKTYLNETAYKYRIISSDEDIAEMEEAQKQNIHNAADYKIKAIPPPIALAMAALESGWGTSRFVFEGNNLFGHVAINPKKGLQPANWTGKTRNIMVFESIQESISVYMLNLNRNRAYNRFRIARKHTPHNLINMTKGFHLYSIIGDEYAGRLQFIISRYGFATYLDATLDDEKRTSPLKALRQAYIQ